MNGSQETDDLFSVTTYNGSIIDLSVEVRLVESEAPTAGDVPAGATLGQIYGDYLDGIASGLLAPVGLVVLP